MNSGSSQNDARWPVGLQAGGFEVKQAHVRLFAAAALGGMSALAWVAWALMAYAAAE